MKWMEGLRVTEVQSADKEAKKGLSPITSSLSNIISSIQVQHLAFERIWNQSRGLDETKKQDYDFLGIYLGAERDTGSGLKWGEWVCLVVENYKSEVVKQFADIEICMFISSPTHYLYLFWTELTQIWVRILSLVRQNVTFFILELVQSKKTELISRGVTQRSLC